MKILLKDFQIEHVDKLVANLRRASRFAAEGELQAVSLSAPTGSGKTVMITAAIERLLEGDEDAGPNPNTVFLWITDQPELNEQTRRRMIQVSHLLGPSRLRVIDTDFDQEILTPGMVYFLNTQKLGKKGLLNAHGDKRQYTFFETVNNTAAQSPGDFYVLIDEAHRGMGQSPQATKEAQAIIQKFIIGQSGEANPVPLIVGISATPKRFDDLIAGTDRAPKRVSIPPSEVRESGLIKEAIVFWHPTEKQQGDMTLLRSAVQAWRNYQHHWSDYSAKEGIAMVRPLLVLQVEDAPGKSDTGEEAGAKAKETAATKTNLDEVLACLDTELGGFPSEAIAHAFDRHTPITVGSRTIRYLAPSDIDSDPHVQVILFKTSLSVGWDCPRAEVMMSFRSATDSTNIAQLVGRMVRTPLARRVDSNEHLNTVALYLPHYDAKGLEEVVKKLTEPGSSLLPPTEARAGEESVTVRRATDTDVIFAALSRLPSYAVPRAATPSETRRVMKLARRLNIDGLRETAIEETQAALLEVIDTALGRRASSPEFQAIIEERDTLDIQLVTYLLYGTLSTTGEAQKLQAANEDIDGLFEAAGRKLLEGIHKTWWRKRVTEGKVSTRQAKLELSALTNADLKRDIEAVAKKKANGYLIRHQAQIATLSEAKRQAYVDIHGLATEPVLTPLSYPDVLEVSKKNTAPWKKHLYIAEDASYPADLNEWETPVLEAELKRPDTIGWLRNVPRKPWALAAPYKEGDKWKRVFPDFLTIRQTSDGLKIDIIDPHTSSFADAAPKLVGLAQYAQDHGAEFGRIESITVKDGEIRRLNLQDEKIREAIFKRIKTSSDVKSFFDDYATSIPT